MVTGGALRIVFFGTPDFAVPSLQAMIDSRHQVVGVVTQPDRPRGRGQHAQPPPVKALAVTAGLPVMQPERLRNEDFLEAFRTLNADIGVVAAYGKILTDAVLQIPPKGLINVHASLLPKYRGAAPIHRAVMAGETKTGITIMRVVKALDAGPMISAVSRTIGRDETSADVERALATLGSGALLDALDAIASGRAVETPQDDQQATYAHRIEKADGLIDWSHSAEAIRNQIRGLYPWPHAYSVLDGDRTILLRAQVDAATGGANAAPGEIVQAAGDELLVQTGDGILRLLELQREGRRPVTAREFLAGRALTRGARFGSPSSTP